jgi:two-component system sensor histidine kinase KdpD
VTTALPEALPLVSIDPVLLEQVFVNLIENATKYTPPGSPLELRARCTTVGVEILVADRGPGVPPGLEERVFERFYRGTHVGVGGAGLGLPISRGIVEAHGGTLTVRAREGGGAEFRVLLPLPGPMPAPPPEAPLADAEAP